MALILGIDPGSRKTGYGVIAQEGRVLRYLASGVIRPPLGDDLCGRLGVLFDGMRQILMQYQPDECAIEKVFMAKNAASALVLGQARGALLAALADARLPVAEYETRKVKQAVTGQGNADKVQVQQMVQSLLRLSGSPQEDAADALAVALCHAQTRCYIAATGLGVDRFRRGRLSSGVAP